MGLTRRSLLKGAGWALFGTLVSGGYAFGLEPFSLRIQRYRLTPAGWPGGLRLKIAALADIHACRPWMDPARIRAIAEQANSLEPDVIVLLGDYMAGHRWVTGRVEAREWAGALRGLRARLGVYAILGNHDWWTDRAAQQAGKGPVVSRLALENAGIPVLENDAMRLGMAGARFWIAGLGDQLAFVVPRRDRVREGPAGQDRARFRGVDDLSGTLAKVTDGAPVILLAHEPDIFPQVPARVALTLSGHTHGGQIRLFGWSPVVPSRYGNRYAYGHISETAGSLDVALRHLVVSGGLGCSVMPVRAGVPPEITVVELGG
jgi:predicted MPP superfamily phosphohydrolase